MLSFGPIIDGTIAPGFEPVRRAFAENFQSRGEWGASVCVWHRGRVVVDLWGGSSDGKPGLTRSVKKPFLPTTLTNGFSTTKGIVALCFLMLADRGKLDYDAPVSTYWPAFAHGGKAPTTVRCLLNHRSGLIGLDTDLTLDELESDPDRVLEVLEAQRPLWRPDTDQGYHAVTFGLYAGALFKKITGESIGAFVAREVAGPLRADFYLGLPEALEPRVAPVFAATIGERIFKIVPKAAFHLGNEGRVYREVLAGRDTATAFAHPKALGMRGIHNFNTRQVRRMELPWANGITSARGLCRVYAALANRGTLDGTTLVRPEAIVPLYRRQTWSRVDRTLRKPLGWSQGFLKEETSLFSPNKESFGHAGAGGALGWCDPVEELAIGYVTTKMAHHVRSPRAIALCHAIYDSLVS